MLLVENHHTSSKGNMVSSTLQMGRSTNGDVEGYFHNQKDQVLTQNLHRRQGDSVANGVSTITHQGDEDLSVISNRDSVGDELPNVASKSVTRQSDMTLEEMYNNHYNFDDDDDDEDSDWEPLEKRFEVVKWFCVNCTMVNHDDVVHCDVCGEHRESGILKRGYFASPYLPDGGASQNSEVIEKFKDKRDAPANSTLVGFDERMLLHAEVNMKSHPHPERPDRVRAIAASLETAGIFPGRCSPILAREITREELQTVHALENIEAVELTSCMLASYFTPDTYANEHSALAARLAAGLCADLASAIFSGRAKNGFALVRPPGHHAGVKQAMGFCLHNNAAVAANAAQIAGAKKVLIIDWDVHHGNGTQEIFDRSKSVLYISLHRHEDGRFYPGTGAANEHFCWKGYGAAEADELLDGLSLISVSATIFRLHIITVIVFSILQVGSMGAEGYCVNIPWSRGGVGDNDYIFAFQNIVLPIASEFAPDFTIISAGFDAARGDPLGGCDVTPAGYAQMTEMLSKFADGKLLVILEGGYNLRSISSSAAAVVKVLLGESPGSNVENILPSKSGLRTILEVLKIQKNFWPKLEPSLLKLQEEWELYALQDIKKQVTKRRRAVLPVWWRLGRKRLLYRILRNQLCSRSRSVKWFNSL